MLPRLSHTHAPTDLSSTQFSALLLCFLVLFAQFAYAQAREDHRADPTLLTGSLHSDTSPEKQLLLHATRLPDLPKLHLP